MTRPTPGREPSGLGAWTIARELPSAHSRSAPARVPGRSSSKALGVRAPSHSREQDRPPRTGKPSTARSSGLPSMIRTACHRTSLEPCAAAMALLIEPFSTSPYSAAQQYSMTWAFSGVSTVTDGRHTAKTEARAQGRAGQTGSRLTGNSDGQARAAAGTTPAGSPQWPYLFMCS